LLVFWRLLQPKGTLIPPHPQLLVIARYKDGRTLTDLKPTHDRATAKSIFRSQTKGQRVYQEKMPNGTIRRWSDDGTQIRMNPDGSTRLDLPGRGPAGNETIHFNP
jgi:hypothetical protein